MQTPVLARVCPGSTFVSRVVACDIHRPFPDDLRNRAGEARLGDRIVPMMASMDRLPFR